MDFFLIVVAVLCAVIAAGVTDLRVFLSPEVVAGRHKVEFFSPNTASPPKSALKNRGGPIANPQSSIGDS